MSAAKRCWWDHVEASSIQYNYFSSDNTRIHRTTCSALCIIPTIRYGKCFVFVFVCVLVGYWFRFWHGMHQWILCSMTYEMLRCIYIACFAWVCFTKIPFHSSIKSGSFKFFLFHHGSVSHLFYFISFPITCVYWVNMKHISVVYEAKRHFTHFVAKYQREPNAVVFSHKIVALFYPSN